MFRWTLDVAMLRQTIRDQGLKIHTISWMSSNWASESSCILPNPRSMPGLPGCCRKGSSSRVTSSGLELVTIRTSFKMLGNFVRGGSRNFRKWGCTPPIWTLKAWKKTTSFFALKVHKKWKSVPNKRIPGIFDQNTIQGKIPKSAEIRGRAPHAHPPP